MSTPTFTKERHIKYFLRCLKTLLPHQYTAGDGGRILLGFFTIAGLDLLGVLETSTTPEERQGYIDWVYHCQHPSGGFRGFTGTKFGDDKHTRENEAWDPANIPSTFLALETLLILGDDLTRLKRKECLQWLPKLQRKDGSFGELLGVDEGIEGGNDLRFCYCAAGIRYFLRGPHGKDVSGVKDIDVANLASFIQSCQSYDGGMGETSFREAHAGLTYCAVGALSFLEKTEKGSNHTTILSPQSQRFDSLLKWLLSRQTHEIEEKDDESDEADAGENPELASAAPPHAEADDAKDTTKINQQIEELPDILPFPSASLAWAGFNGRWNKLADTCYCFWVTGALGIMDRLSLVDVASHRGYLLEKTQHLIGGFGKAVGEPPDLYHSYLGMVALALINEPGIAAADPVLCAGASLQENLKSLSWWQE